ncbi:hypothetical protein GHH_c34050 [Geobacillus sp. GHH01]|uniref:hypothetical protein n=1 Tax=Geobacillus sp. GHH01 TaxID=1233873 RepID=UPI0002AF422C|nr:hypothetical protein [Geobacillus sp. GHH01]AGE23895.1 hypothetical protein GHH_c34050 [Geobacillus sp. GHH01]
MILGNNISNSNIENVLSANELTINTYNFNKKKMTLSNFIMLINIMSFFYILLSGPLYYLQYKFFGAIIFPVTIAKLTILFSSYLWIIIILNRKMLIPCHRGLLIVTIINMIYGLISVMVHILAYGYSLERSIYSLNYMVGWFFITFPFLLMNKFANVSVNLSKFEKYIYIISWPLFFIGYLQTLYNSPLVFQGLGWEYVHKITDDYTIIFGYFLGQNIRAFSLFQSPLVYGFFSVFVNLMSLAGIILYKNRLFIRIITYIMSQISIWSTLTRNVILWMIISNIFLVLYYYRKKIKLNLILHYYPYLAFLIVVLILTIISNETSGASLLNNETLNVRKDTWIEIIKNMNLFSFLFGLGEVQSEQVSDNLVIDNLFIAFVIYNGLIGLFFFLLWFIIFWKYFHSLSLEISNLFLLTCVSLCSGFLVVSLFNNTVGTLYMFYLPLIFYQITVRKRFRERE